MLMERTDSMAGGEHERPRPRRYHARRVMRADDEGFVICECPGRPGCSGCNPPGQCQRPALWLLEREDETLQLCGNCANRRTAWRNRKQELTPLAEGPGPPSPDSMEPGGGQA
jgi:hypothetical protein